MIKNSLSQQGFFWPCVVTWLSVSRHGQQARLTIQPRRAMNLRARLRCVLDRAFGSVSRQGPWCCDMVPKYARRIGSRQSFFLLPYVATEIWCRNRNWGWARGVLGHDKDFLVS